MADQHYGRDCPEGMVQVAFVGVSPKLRRGEYGWKPSPHAFIEISVDGQIWRIDIGTYESARGGARRGLHINGPLDMRVDKHSANAVDLFVDPK